MTQRRRAEVSVTCDVPGCFAVWQHVGEREHAMGRDHQWFHVYVSRPGFSGSDNLDFCPRHGRTPEALQIIGSALHKGNDEKGGNG